MIHSAPARRAPWNTGDLVAVAAPVAVGGVVVIAAWTGASAKYKLDDQKGWIVLGVVGLLLAVVAQGLWVRRMRKTVARHAAEVLAGTAALTAGPAVALASVPTAATVGDGLVAAEGLTHFHRSSCPIARQRNWTPVPRATHEAAGRTPCGICLGGTPPDPESAMRGRS